MTSLIYMEIRKSPIAQKIFQMLNTTLKMDSHMTSFHMTFKILHLLISEMHPRQKVQSVIYLIVLPYRHVFLCYGMEINSFWTE